MRDGLVGIAGRLDRIAAVQEEHGQRLEKVRGPLVLRGRGQLLSMARRLEGIQEHVRGVEGQQRSPAPSTVSTTSSASDQDPWFQDPAVLRVVARGGLVSNDAASQAVRPVLQAVGAWSCACKDLRWAVASQHTHTGPSPKGRRSCSGPLQRAVIGTRDAPLMAEGPSVAQVEIWPLTGPERSATELGIWAASRTPSTLVSQQGVMVQDWGPLGYVRVAEAGRRRSACSSSRPRFRRTRPRGQAARCSRVPSPLEAPEAMRPGRRRRPRGSAPPGDAPPHMHGANAGRRLARRSRSSRRTAERCAILTRRPVAARWRSSAACAAAWIWCPCA